MTFEAIKTVVEQGGEVDPSIIAWLVSEVERLTARDGDLYKPLRIRNTEVHGINHALRAMRKPHAQKGRTFTFEEDLALAAKLIKAGDDHGKCVRGIDVWFEMDCQIGWLIEYVTYKIGTDCLSSSSTMHVELKELAGVALANEKQRGLAEKVYDRSEKVSYQALRHIYFARRNHRHPDWKIVCKWIETLPHFKWLIAPELLDLKGRKVHPYRELDRSQLVELFSEVVTAERLPRTDYSFTEGWNEACSRIEESLREAAAIWL